MCYILVLGRAVKGQSWSPTDGQGHFCFMSGQLSGQLHNSSKSSTCTRVEVNIIKAYSSKK